MKPIEYREADFRKQVNQFIKYPVEMRNAFADYWTEQNKSGTKMKFELEKTWDTGRRLGTWDRNNFNKEYKKPQAPVISMIKAPENDIERLDDILRRYNRAPSAITIEKLSAWDGLDRIYDTIKKHRLWDERITKQELSAFTEPQKVKAYIVIRTLDYYGIKGWTFSDTIKLRKHG